MKVFNINRIQAIILLCICTLFVQQTVYADDAQVLVTKINTWSHDGTGTLEASVNELDDSEVIISGEVTDATNSLTLNIDLGVIVNWQAKMSGKGTITLSGSGVFLVTDGKIDYLGDHFSIALLSAGANSITVNDGEISGGIVAYGDNNIITVNGGTVSGATVDKENNHAIYANGSNNVVTVTGGMVTTTGDWHVIFMDNEDNNGKNVVVNGEGKVIASGSGMAISTYGSVEVDGNAEVTAVSNNAVYLRGTVTSGTITVNGGTVSTDEWITIAAEGIGSKVIVTGGTVTKTGDEQPMAVIFLSNAGNTGLNVVVSGEGKVIQTSGGSCIVTNGSVEVKDEAEVSSTTGSAINVRGQSGTVTVSGGIVTSTSTLALGGAVIFIESQQNTGLNVVVTGTGKVVQAGDGNGITTYGSIEVKDKAEITVSNFAIRVMGQGTATITGGTISASATDGRGISAEGANSKVIVTGGTITATNGRGIFADGNKSKIIVTGGSVSGVYGISLFHQDAVAFVWGVTVTVNPFGANSIDVRKAGSEVYFIAGTKDELTVNPAGASVEWAVDNGKSGIYYERNTNEGFLEVAGITVLEAQYTIDLTEPDPGIGSITVWNGDDPVTTFPAVIESIASLTLKAEPADGFEFVQWWDGEKDIDYTFVLAGNITISATFLATGATTYTVTFVYNDETNKVETIAIEANNTVDEPKPPTKEGYKFMGWFLGETEFDFSVPINDDISLSAKWEEVVPVTTYTVTFVYNNGNENKVETVVDGEKVDQPTDPSRQGYTFDGWFMDDEVFDFNTLITGNITLNAVWTAVPTGTGEIFAPDLKVFPNPFAGMIRIRGAEGSILQVIDGNGVIVHIQKMDNYDETLRLEHLQSGVYFFRIQKDKQMVTLKAVKN